jgi:hypothetical protein
MPWKNLLQSCAALGDLIRPEGDSVKKERLRLAEQLPAEVNDGEDDERGEFDAADTLRHLRDDGFTTRTDRSARPARVPQSSTPPA